MKKLEIEGLKNEAQSELARDEQEESVKFSSRLVDYFSTQARSFNKNNDSMLTTNHLKKVYCHGARLGKKHGAEDLNLYAMARVHMFLRLKSGDKMAVGKSAEDVIKVSRLELEEVKKITKFANFIDISESWMPNEDDFENSKKEIDKNNLKHEYENISDLYLEYEPIDTVWD